jgi:hypothetical protein
MVRRSAGGRVVALASGLLLVLACLALPVAALASYADSCHGTPLSYGRCDGTSPAFGQSNLAVPADPPHIPALPAPRNLLGEPSAAVPDYSFHSSLSARAPPRS